jgi:hypothetical protein
MRPYQATGLLIMAEFAGQLAGRAVRDVTADDLEMLFRVMPAYSITGVWISVNCVRNVGKTIVAICPELGTDLTTTTESYPLSIDTQLTFREAPHLAYVFFGSFINPAEALDVMRKIPIYAVAPHALN